MGVATQLGSVWFFAGVWVSMMAAMMLPGALPAAARSVRADGRARAVPLFIASYLAVWTLTAALYGSSQFRWRDRDVETDVVGTAPIALPDVVEFVRTPRCLRVCASGEADDLHVDAADTGERLWIESEFMHVCRGH